MVKNFYNTAGINTSINPIAPENDGVLVHAVNVDSFPSGVKRKRSGYERYLNVPDSFQVNSMWQYSKGTQFWNYRASGSLVYYSEMGTGDWTICGNGTISFGRGVGNAILADTLIIGDGAGSTRHTTNGTSFTNTTLAPVAEFFEEYQNRIYAAGTTSTLFFSTANDPTNWQTSGTSDSSSLQIPGDGQINGVFKVADRIISTKTSQAMHSWDGYSRSDLATLYGPSSPRSVAEIEGYKLYINPFGLYGFGGGQPELLSKPIQRQFYNPTDLTISVTGEFLSAPGAVFAHDYYVSVGTVVDDFTERTINNTVIKYDVQKNEFVDWSLAAKPTAFFTGKKTNNLRAMYFGDTTGNTYEFIPGFKTDEGKPIASEMILVFTMGAPHYDKKWNWYRGIFNPGCQAKVQVACSNLFDFPRLQWKDLGDTQHGFVEYRFPQESRSKFLFVRIYETGIGPAWSYYGCSLDADIIQR